MRNFMQIGDGVESKVQPWKPHGYQRNAVKFLLSRGAGGLFLDPG